MKIRLILCLWWGAAAVLWAAAPDPPSASYWLLLDAATGQVTAESATGLPPDMGGRLVQPGSTLKPFLLAAAMEGGLKPERAFYCPARPITDPPERRCYLAAGHGGVNLSQALAQSCSAYARQACAFVDADRYRRLLEEYGLRAGLPSPERFRALGCEVWMGAKPGLAATPLELANAYRAAFGGAAKSKPLTGLAWLRQGLRECCLTGTGRRVRQAQPLLSILGKTGTSETAAGRQLGLFVGLTPAENPRLILVVLVENADGAAAAELAGKVVWSRNQNR
ncbi:MAG: hypothetical protein GX444_03775 [Myxococcales bacterium]|nr:hypothetical protein [Myxococcales bacterium]